MATISWFKNIFNIRETGPTAGPQKLTHTYNSLFSLDGHAERKFPDHYSTFSDLRGPKPGVFFGPFPNSAGNVLHRPYLSTTGKPMVKN